MIVYKNKLLLVYWILINPPINKQASAFVTGKMKFYRSKYFDERSIHADIGRDMNVVCNHVKAFNVGKQNTRDNDVINYAKDANVDDQEDNGDINYSNDGNAINDDPVNDVNNNNDAINYASADDNLAGKEEDIESKVDNTSRIIIPTLKNKELEADTKKANISRNKDFIETTATERKRQESMPVQKDTQTNSSAGYEQMEGNLQKREVAMGGKSNMEAEGQGNMAEHTGRHSPAAPRGLEQPKRLINQKQYVAPEEPFQKKKLDLMRQEVKNMVRSFGIKSLVSICELAQ